LAFKFIVTANSKLRRNSRFYRQILPTMAVNAGNSECFSPERFSPERLQEFDSHSYSAQITVGKVAIWGPHCFTRSKYSKTCL